MSPQRSNRANLVEGALRCLERLPPERVTARAIAEESGANAASINYHFGSKDELISEAVVTGLDRWLEEIDRQLAEASPEDPRVQFRRAIETIETGRKQHAGLARNFFGALAKANHDDSVRRALADGFSRTRPNVASLLGLGSDRAGEDAGGLVLALFYGHLLQLLLDPALAIEGKRMQRAQGRLLRVLPEA